jgi:hypothetical protein
MTPNMTHTTLSGAATRDMTAGLLLGFLDAAWYGPAKPPPHSSSFMYTETLFFCD